MNNSSTIHDSDAVLRKKTANHFGTRKFIGNPDDYDFIRENLSILHFNSNDIFVTKKWRPENAINVIFEKLDENSTIFVHSMGDAIKNCVDVILLAQLRADFSMEIKCEVDSIAVVDRFIPKKTHLPSFENERNVLTLLVRISKGELKNKEENELEMNVDFGSSKLVDKDDFEFIKQHINTCIPNNTDVHISSHSQVEKRSQHILNKFLEGCDFVNVYGMGNAIKYAIDAAIRCKRKSTTPLKCSLCISPTFLTDRYIPKKT
eukprot:TRINITY_DN2535_c0_g1_i2.p1 TRINITY_DN2535_c0_g1~~TRINITY_DN2535_c0_g1_i2.p1  ORF type:complete len:262 (+),score=55.86 TRINITY_DN2535_c0_g1_i2:130-915(+)